jgi:hypothetical protein
MYSARNFAKYLRDRGATIESATAATVVASYRERRIDARFNGQDGRFGIGFVGGAWTPGPNAQDGWRLSLKALVDALDLPPVKIGAYVSVINGSKSSMLLGPYDSKREAEANVDRARAHLAEINYPDHEWFGYGTSRVMVREGRALPEGKLNRILGLVEPTCSKHGATMARRTQVGTKEQAWCGTWYDCTDPHCRTSVLLHSAELESSHAEQRAALAAAEGE